VACKEQIERIQELVDGSLGSIRRAELEQHLASCAECRALRDDLERIRDAAAALPALSPPDGAWMQIAGRLRQEGRIRDDAASPAPRKSYAWLGLAAAIVLAAAVSALLLFRSTPQPSVPAQTATGNPGDTKAVEAVQNEVETAQQQFESAIAKMDDLRKANMNALDPQTSEVIEKNLGIIDRAIAENRAAVKAEPSSVAARETLFEVLRQKVSLLQDTISLINEMRKGNNAAAAQMVHKS